MKKHLFFPAICCLFSIFLSSATTAQEAALTADFKQSAVDQIATLLQERYVLPDVARKAGEHLKSKLQAGHFDAHKDLKTFAEALTTEAQAVTKDKHMRIRPVPPRQAPPNTLERMVEERLNDIAQQREAVAGFAAVKKFEGNVGYLDIRFFAGVEWGAPIADHYMALLATSDAIIIDLRKNGGGNPGMVQYLCSYFFDKKVHLNSLYWREGDRTQEFWTLDKVGGHKMPAVPLFVLTSNRTFSGAEEFSYNMKTQKRATLVGETTGGGANPGGGFPVNEQLMIFIPTGKAINPVTKTNWEGLGVVPEVKVPEAEALDKALDLAVKSAAEYRQVNKEKNAALLRELFESVESGSKDNVQASLKKNLVANLLNEEDINALGYEYLMRHNKPEAAELIFYSNTALFPHSANTYDSYGEALAANGKMEESLKAYRKAVEIARAGQSPNLPMFEENLKKVEEKSKKKP